MPGVTTKLFTAFLNIFHISIYTKQRKTEKDNWKEENKIDLCITEPFPKNIRYKEENNGQFAANKGEYGEKNLYEKRQLWANRANKGGIRRTKT